jgi:dTDP-4-dehydrorhamnose reductase
MNILVFGAGSRLSFSLNMLLRDYDMYKVICVSSKDKPDWITNQEWIIGEISDFNFVKDIIQKNKPDVIVNLAAYTDVDGCEEDKFKSHQINYEFPNLLSEISLKDFIKLIHISTDYVFDGNQGLYKITDTPSKSNLSWYALSKKDSEAKVLESNGCVIRTNVLYDSGHGAIDFVKWLKEQIEIDTQVYIVYDQFNNPTSYEDLAKSIVKVIEKDIKGIIHTGGIDWMSRWELAQVVALSLNKNPETLNMKSISSKDMNQKAIRPMYGGLDISESEIMLDMKFEGIYDYIIKTSDLNVKGLESHYTIFKKLIEILRKIPNDLRKSISIKCKKNSHKTISIILENKNIWSEIEIGLNSYSGILYKNDNMNLNLHIGDIYTDDTIENFIKSLHKFLVK